MESESGSWTWLLIDVLFVAVLGAAILYGIMVTARRRRDRLTEAAATRPPASFTARVRIRRRLPSSRSAWFGTRSFPGFIPPCEPKLRPATGRSCLPRSQGL